MIHIGKAIVISFKDGEEEALERVLPVLTNEVQIEPMQADTCPVLQYPGLEIRQHQRRVLRDGSDIYLTRLEYGTLVYLASYPGQFFSQEQNFENVWHMDSENCQSSVVNVIYNLWKKIEPDSKKTTYIKTVIGVGYKFDMLK